MEEGYSTMHGEFPRWVRPSDRRLLQAPSTNSKSIVPDLIVAKDGRGHFTTISAAVDAAPNKSKKRFVIYIKAGAYFENVEVPKSKLNIMFIGDGIGKTVIKANRNVVDGWTTFRPATLGSCRNLNFFSSPNGDLWPPLCHCKIRSVNSRATNTEVLSSAKAIQVVAVHILFGCDDE